LNLLVMPSESSPSTALRILFGVQERLGDVV
jgi:hypothetical protein